MKRIFLFAMAISLLAASISFSQSKFTETVTVNSTFSKAVEQTSLTIPPVLLIPDRALLTPVQLILIWGC